MHPSKRLLCIALISALMFVAGCKRSQDDVGSAGKLPDLNAQARPYVTIENTQLRTGPGDQFRIIGEIRANSRVQAVGKDGEWLLIVSKKGNAPGYINAAAVTPAKGDEKETAAPTAGEYKVLADTQVRSGPGPSYSVVANIPKGIKINVVNEENGWLEVQSKQGNPPGYVEASVAEPAAK